MIQHAIRIEVCVETAGWQVQLADGAACVQVHGLYAFFQMCQDDIWRVRMMLVWMPHGSSIPASAVRSLQIMTNCSAMSTGVWGSGMSTGWL